MAMINRLYARRKLMPAPAMATAMHYSSHLLFSDNIAGAGNMLTTRTFSSLILTTTNTDAAASTPNPNPSCFQPNQHTPPRYPSRRLLKFLNKLLSSERKPKHDLLRVLPDPHPQTIRMNWILQDMIEALWRREGEVVTSGQAEGLKCKALVANQPNSIFSISTSGAVFFVSRGFQDEIADEEGVTEDICHVLFTLYNPLRFFLPQVMIKLDSSSVIMTRPYL